MFPEEALNALGNHRHLVLLAQTGGDLLEAQSGLLNVFHQDPQGGLRTQPSHGTGRRHQSRLLALLAIELRVGGQVNELASKSDSVQAAGLVQAGQDGITRVLEFVRELAGRQSSGTVCQEVIDGGGQAAVFGEAYPAVMPQAVPVKVRRVVEGVPLAVVGVAAAIADLFEEAPHRDEGVTQGLSQLVEHPAFAAVEQFFQAPGRIEWRSHGV